MAFSKSWPAAFFFLPAAIYYGIIFWLSSQSRFPVRSPFSGFDKFIHVGIFCLFGAFLAWGMTRAGMPAKKAVLIAFLIGVWGGSADEFHQYFVPGRQCDVWDAAADAVGIALGIAVWFRIVRYRKKRLSGENHR